jgi:hypothetical protein
MSSEVEQTIQAFLKDLQEDTDDNADIARIFSDYLTDHDIWTEPMLRSLVIQTKHTFNEPIRRMYADWCNNHSRPVTAMLIESMLASPALCTGFEVNVTSADKVQLTRAFAETGPSIPLQQAYLPNLKEKITLDLAVRVALFGTPKPISRASCPLPEESSVTLQRGFVQEIHDFSIEQWYKYGPKLVRLHPITLAVPDDYMPLIAHVDNGMRDEWNRVVRSYYCVPDAMPEWLRDFYRTISPPARSSYEDALYHLSDVLIQWAEAQEVQC